MYGLSSFVVNKQVTMFVLNTVKHRDLVQIESRSKQLI